MTLLAQVAIVLGAAAVLGLLLRPRRRRWLHASDVVVVGVVLLVVFSVDGAVDQFRGMETQARNDADVPRTDAEKAGWTGNDELEGFVEWLRKELPEDATFHMIIGQTTPEFYTWATYRLLPRLQVTADGSDWLVFVRTDPAQAGLGSVPSTDQRIYAPGLSIVRGKG
jgi:hypothetical protein